MDKTQKNGQTTLGRRQRNLLSESALIEEELLPDFVRPMLTFSALALAAFVLWAALTQIKEVARAPGEILPVSKIKVVQHLDGGVVTEIPVEERMLVQEGQVLLRMDGSQALAELHQMEARQVALRLRAERLSAFAEGRKANLAVLSGSHPDLLANQQQIYQTQVTTRSSTASILNHQIQQRTERLSQLESALASAKEQLGLTNELSTMREDLGSRRLVNRTVLLETRRAKVTASGEVDRLNQEILVSRQELAEIRSRRADTLNQLRRDALNEMGAVRAESAEIEESLKRLRAKVDRLIVRAPHRGLIQDLKVQTVGQVVQPGALLMQVVPDDVPLEAEVRIAPKDIGHIRVGQPVNLRVSSFEYTRFGYAAGTLKRMSASSVVDPQSNQLFYRGWVTLTNPYVGSTPGQYMVQPGMSLEADIITGEKTLLTYLVKPVADAFSSAFRER